MSNSQTEREQATLTINRLTELDSLTKEQSAELREAFETLQALESNGSANYWRGVAMHERTLRGEVKKYHREVVADFWEYLPKDYREEYEKQLRGAIANNHAHYDAPVTVDGIDLWRQRQEYSKACIEAGIDPDDESLTPEEEAVLLKAGIGRGLLPTVY